MNTDKSERSVGRDERGGGGGGGAYQTYTPLYFYSVRDVENLVHRELHITEFQDPACNICGKNAAHSTKLVNMQPQWMKKRTCKCSTCNYRVYIMFLDCDD